LPSEVRAQLERLEASPLFAGSARLIALLRFVVEETLNGCGRSLKEAVIGNAVYSREPPYDPQIDSTVRVEAARLRRKLREYYVSEGQLDAVTIGLPTGGYVPTFMHRRGEEAPKHRAPAPGASGRADDEWTGTTIAVLPMCSSTHDPDDGRLAEGLSAALATAIARSPGLQAVSHGSALQRGQDPDGLSAAELGVDALLRGAVGRSGEHINATIELCDHRGLVVWSERFDAPAAEGTALRRRICTLVADRVRFDGCRGPRSVEMLATVLRGRQLLDEQTPGALQVALQLFSSVCRSAPDYARGHAGVADTYCDLYRLGLVSRAMALGAAKPAALRALQLDAQSAEAHAALATISSWLERGRMTAESHFEQALELGDDGRAARLYGSHLTLVGRDREAEARFRAARALEPDSVHQEIAEATSQYHARRHGALVAASLDEERVPRSVESLFYLMLSMVFAGEPDAARPLLAELGRAAGRRPDLMFARAELEAWLGEPQRARALLDDAGSDATHFAHATLAAAVGDDRRCLDELDASANRREYPTVWLRGDARFDRVRGSNRFTRLLERLDGDQAEMSYCGYLIEHDLCPRRAAPNTCAGHTSCHAESLG
jgi:TolB-like protein